MREIEAATVEPLTLQEVRVHLRQMGDGYPEQDVPDDSWVLAKITAARQVAEDFIGYPLSNAVYLKTYDSFDTGPDLEAPEGTTEIVALRYLDEDGALQTMAPTAYEYDSVTLGVYLDEQPELSTRPSPIRLEYRGKYGIDSPPVPVKESIKHAMLLMIGHWYENRESQEMPLGAESLLRSERIRLGMA